MNLTSLPFTNLKPMVPLATNTLIDNLMPSVKLPEIDVILTRPHKGTLT